MAKAKASLTVVRRLPRYYHYLNDLLDNGVTKISSKELSERMGITASQIRQDLNCFGGFGQQGYGYNVEMLRDEIAQILTLDQCQDAILVGAGNLGRAIANHIDFEGQGFKLIGIFDNDPAVIGKVFGCSVVRDIKEMDEFVIKEKPAVGILTMPSDEAVKMVNKMVGIGIHAFWNFTGKDLSIPDVLFEDMHLGDSLMTLRYRISELNREKSREKKHTKNT